MRVELCRFLVPGRGATRNPLTRRPPASHEHGYWSAGPERGILESLFARCSLDKDLDVICEEKRAVLAVQERNDQQTPGPVVGFHFTWDLTVLVFLLLVSHAFGLWLRDDLAGFSGLFLGALSAAASRLLSLVGAGPGLVGEMPPEKRLGPASLGFEKWIEFPARIVASRTIRTRQVSDRHH